MDINNYEIIVYYAFLDFFIRVFIFSFICLVILYFLEASPVTNQDFGRLLLLHMRSARTASRSRCLLCSDGSGYGGRYCVSFTNNYLMVNTINQLLTTDPDLCNM